MTPIEELKEKAKKAPVGPGIYIFLDKSKKPLYVGRAINLRRRLSSYFRSDLDPAKKEMVSLAKNLKTTETKSLLEAIILEANLIKKYWPKYNIKEKDNRSFLYIIFSPKSLSYPIVVREREMKKFSFQQKGKNKIKIFGPYQNYYLIKNFLKIIRRIFPYSDCEVGKACFNHQIGLCPGVCAGVADSEKIHKENIKNIILLLKGKSKRILDKLKKNHPEKALALQHIQDVALISEGEKNITSFGGRIEAYDISHFGGKETVGAMAVFSQGEPDKKQYRLFKIKYSPQNDDLRALYEMISRRLNHSEWPLADIVLIDGGRPQVDFIAKLLKEKNAVGRLVGISKLSDDKLVFPVGANSQFKELCEIARPTLISARDEAHRFANNYRKKLSKIKV